MNISFRLHDKAARALGKALYTGLAVWMLGAVCSPAHAATTVAVDQQPLIIQQPLPPNITLMLDDSGSMGWDYMPDRNYLASTSNDGYRDSANNGVYFNPTITYTPPPKADGTSYPVQTHVTAAFVDGFATTPNAVDVTRYSNTFPFYTAFSFTQTSTYDATFGPVTTTTYTCPDGYSLYQGDRCRENSWPHYKIDATATPTTVDVWYCQQGDVLDAATNKCTATTITQRYYFTYTTGAAAGPYTQHYVGKAGDCTALPALPAASQAVCDDSAATRQNVANWFSYYHTRILMAKSGLMNAFTTIDPTFRIGFGSINGNNDSHLPAPKATFGSNGNVIAEVTPFGDGSALTQKASFWNWVAGESVGSSTPLRASLDAVGRYYQDPQPWSTMTTDPNYSANAGTELACRQSYTILTTDGFWNGPTPSSVGNEDGTNGTKVTGPNGQSYTYTAALPYKDANSDTLADVAMKYWETDLRTTTANEVSTSTEDPAFWQHMTTFTLGLGFTPTGIAPSGTTMEQIFNWANGGTAISGFSWPTPTFNSINNIADLAHAAVDGHGGFYSASTPQAFASGLTDALKRATERVGTGASLAANSTKLTTGTVAYQANYYTSKWKGDLKALAIDPATGTIATTPSWSAASALPAFGSRNIKTYNPVSNATVAFTAAQLSSLSTAEQSALGTSATAQAAMINYLRGDASQEEKNSGAYRNRDTPLGDVVDSQPVYVGAPDPNQFIGESFAGSSTFAAWANNKLSRAQVVLMAANDGMLHAVNAGTGAETFAYLPAAVITSGLSALANPSYGVTTAVPHQYFNDGELTVADVYFTASTDWHTVAVGTTGRGTARAIYALDVTDPANITLLWERSAGDGKTNSNYIGQMTGKPVISQTSDGTWSVLLGNGYNSSAGVAALLQFNVTDGTLYVHPVTDTSLGNGLAAPAVWIGDLTNGISTVAYAGDLHGQVWSFALNTGVTAYTATPTSAGVKLFTAEDANGNVQPITAGMLAGKDSATSNLWLFFGTGKYLSVADLPNVATQTWYGIIVQSGTSGLVSSLSTGRSALVQRAIVAETAGDTTATPPISPGRAITPTPSTPDMAGESGWYIDLLSPTGVGGADVQQGERIVTPNQFQGNQLIATTRIPKATDACNPTGAGWIMALNPFTGTAPVSNFFDINGDGSINSGDTITVGGKTYTSSGIGFTALPNNPIFVGSTMLVSFDSGATGSFATSGSGGSLQRVSWRELITQ